MHMHVLLVRVRGGHRLVLREPEHLQEFRGREENPAAMVWTFLETAV